MKIKTKNAKNDVTSTANLALPKDSDIKDNKERSQIRVMEAKKVTWREIMKAVSHILFLEYRAQSMSLQICIGFFTIYSGSNIW